MKKRIRSFFKKTGISILITAMVMEMFPNLIGENRNVQAAAKDAYYSSWTNVGGSYNQTLSTGNYKVVSNTTITAPNGSGYPGLIINGTVNLYIKAGCTLSVKGANASGTTRGCAGIRLTSGNVLKIYGGGTLNATGGAAASGEQGGMNGNNAELNHTNNGQGYGGSGGAGGAGGGGAGAGIGGNGGSGGAGGAGASKKGQRVACIGDNSETNGDNGSSGGYGSAGEEGSGTMYIFDSITVTATGGSAGYGGDSPSPGTGHSSCGEGAATDYCVDDHGSKWKYSYENGGGGVGGGGAGGGAAANIGSGGSGGGGGGGAGGGGLCINGGNVGSNWYLTYPYGGGGYGGTGANNGANNVYCGSGHTYGGEYGDSKASGKATGGTGAYGGVTYPAGTGGTIYVSDGASVTTPASGSGNYAGHASSKNTMSTVTVQANLSDHNKKAAKFATANSTSITTYAYSGLPMSGIDDLPSLEGYTLNGFYSAATGGTQLMDANGYPTGNAWSSSWTTVYAQWTPLTYTLTIPTEGISSLTLHDYTANTAQSWSSLATTASQTYTMTYDHQYNIQATPENDSEGKAKTFIAWYAKLASPATTLQSNNYNSTDNPYTFWCPLYALILKGVALKGVWAEDEISINMADFKKEIVYQTATVTTKLDDKACDMGMVTFVDSSDAKNKYSMSGTGGIYTYTMARDTAYVPKTYKIYVNGADTGKTLNFSNDSTQDINYYTATVILRMDGEAADLGTVSLEPAGSASADGITLNYDKDAKNYSYYAQQDETKDVSGNAAPTIYKVMLNGKDCPGNSTSAKLVSFDKTCTRIFDYYSVKVTTKLNDSQKYMGKLTLVSGDSVAYNLTGNDGTYTARSTAGESTIYSVYINDKDTGTKVSFTDASKRTAQIDYYTVAYDGSSNNSGTVPASSTLLKGTVIKVAAAGDLVRTDKSFAGWNLNSDTKTIYTVGQKMTVKEQMTFKARWIGPEESEARWKGTKDSAWNYGTLADAIDAINLTKAGLDVELLRSAAMLDSASFTLDGNETFTLDKGTVLAMPEGVTITNNGNITVSSNAVIYGSDATLVNNGKIDCCKSDADTVNNTSGGTINVKTVTNTNGNIHGGIIGVAAGDNAVDVTVTGGTINGVIYLADNSTFSGCSVDGGVYYEKKITTSSVYTKTADTSAVSGNTYYEYKDTYTKVEDPQTQQLSTYYVLYGDEYVQNTNYKEVLPGVTYYSKTSAYETVSGNISDPSASGYYVLNTTKGTAYEVTSDTSAVAGKTYYIADGDNYVICASPDFSTATVVSVMGGTTIDKTPTAEQLKINLGGIVKYDSADNKLRFMCNTIFRNDVFLNDISAAPGGYKVSGLKAATVIVEACYSDDIVADGYSSEHVYTVSDRTGGTVRLKYTKNGTSYDSGDTFLDTKTVPTGTSLTVSADAAEGYEFAGWYTALKKDASGNIIGGDGTAVSTSPEYTVGSLTADTSYYALFNRISYDVTVRADKGVDLVVTCGDADTAVSISSNDSHTFKIRYGYGLTMSYSLSNVKYDLSGNVIDETETEPDTYYFNGWFERILTPGDDYNKEYPVDGQSGSKILKNALTISKITSDRIFIATTTIAGTVHYSLNGGSVSINGAEYDSIDEDITNADVRAGYHSVTKYSPSKEGWEFLYWIDADGNKYKLDASGTMSRLTVTSALQKTGITLTAVYAAASDRAFWTVSNNQVIGGFTTLDAAVTATRAVNSASYGCRTIKFDDSAFKGTKDRTVYGTVPDGYTFMTELPDLTLTVSENFSLQVGTETGKGDSAVNTDNSKDGTWHTGATVSGIAFCSEGGTIYIDGQRSAIDRPVSLYPGNKLHFLSDPNTADYFNVTLLNSAGSADTGSIWNNTVFAVSDSTDGDATSTDASSDQHFNLMPGRVKITNFQGSRVYYETCDNAASDSSADSGYSLVAHSMSGAPAAMIVPFADTSIDYTDAGFATSYQKLQDAIYDAARYNSGASVTTDAKTGKTTVNGPAENRIYVTSDSSEALTIAGDNESLDGADFVTVNSDITKNCNPVVILTPAIYTVAGDNNTLLSAGCNDSLTRMLSGAITVARVTDTAHSYSAGSMWILQNLQVTGTVTLEKGCTVSVDAVKTWAGSEQITLNPKNHTHGTVLVYCGTNGNCMDHFKLTDELIAAGYVIYYDSASNAICLGDLSAVYAVDETLENKEDGTLHAANKNLEYISANSVTTVSENWVPFTDTIAGNLKVGYYYVRMAATKTTTASTYREGLYVGVGRKINVLFRQAPTAADPEDATVHEDILKCVYNGSVIVPAIADRTGYTTRGWTYSDDKGNILTLSSDTIDNITADRTYTADYELNKYTVTLPVSTDLYDITLSDGTKITDENKVQTVEYGMSLEFKYKFNDKNTEGISSYDASFKIKRGTSENAIVLNTDGTYVIAGIVNNTEVTVTGTARKAAPSGIGALPETSKGTADGKILSVNDKMEYIPKASYSVSDPDIGWTSVGTGATEISPLAAGTYYVRYKADGTASASAYVEAVVGEGPEKTHILLLTVPEQGSGVYGSEPAPVHMSITSAGTGDVTIISVTSDSGDFTISGNATTVSAAGCCTDYTVKPASGLAAGEHTGTVTVTYYSDTAKTKTATVTAAISYTVTKKPSSDTSAPNGMTVKNETASVSDDVVTPNKDGSISGIPDGCEYSDDGGNTWKDVSGGKIDGIGAGDYEIRYKGTDNAEPGTPVTVTVGQDKENEEPEKIHKMNISAGKMADAQYGYATQPSAAVTYGNNGTVSEDFAVSLTSGSENFTIEGNTSGNLGTGRTGTCTLKLNSGLSVGTYSATVQISYNGGTTSTVSVSLSITKASQTPPAGITGSMSLSENSGKISGLDPSVKYEISTDGGNTWTAVPDGSSEAGSLNEGVYYVRKAGDDNNSPSDPTVIALNSPAVYRLSVPDIDLGTVAYSSGAYNTSAFTIASTGNKDETVSSYASVNPSIFAITAGNKAIAAGTADTSWKIAPAAGLAAADTAYTSQITFTDAKDQTVSANVTVKIVRATRNAPAGLKAVDESVLGRNDGGVSGLVSGESYEYSPDGNKWYPLTSDTKLGYGTYYVRYAKSANYEAGAAAVIKVGAGTAATYTLKLTAPSFAGVTVGYTQPEGKTLTVTSTGNSDATIQKIVFENNNAFDITGPAERTAVVMAGTSTISANGAAASYVITPRAELAAGTYTARVIVYYNDGLSAETTVSFYVSTGQSQPSSGDNTGGSTDDGSGSGSSRKTTTTTTADDDAKLIIIPLPAAGAGDDTAGNGKGGKNTGNEDADNTDDDENKDTSGSTDEPDDNTRQLLDSIDVTAGGETINGADLYDALKDLEIQPGSVMDKNGLSVADVIMAIADPTSKGELVSQAKDNGYIKVTVVNSKDKEVVKASIKSDDDLMSAVLTPEDILRVLAGSKVDIRLEITPLSLNSVPEDRKALLDRQLAGREKVGCYFDASLYKVFLGETPEQITELAKDIDVTLDIPDSLLGSHRTYKVALTHENDDKTVESQVYKDMDTADNTFSFATSKLCTGVIIYKDRLPLCILNILLLFLIAVVALYALIKKKKFFSLSVLMAVVSFIYFMFAEHFHPEHVVWADAATIVMALLFLIAANVRMLPDIVKKVSGKNKKA